MSELSTSEVVRELSKVAHAEENKGHFGQAENLYQAIVTLEEMAQFPANQIKQAKEDLLNCEMHRANEAMKALDANPSKYDLTMPNPKEVNDNGIFRDASGNVHGRPHWKLPAPEATPKKVDKVESTTTDYPDIYPSKGCP